MIAASDSLIPPVLHFCWFGGKPLPAQVEDAIATWQDVMPDFEIKRWGEAEWDVDSTRFSALNHARGKWAFVSDVCRLDVLAKEGGIYLDTDVIAFKSLRPFLKFSTFFGMMFDDSVGTAVIGARAGAPMISALRSYYDELPIGDTPNNDLVTGHLIRSHSEFVLRNVNQSLSDGTAVFKKEYFERLTRRRDAGYTRHLVANTWHDGKDDQGKASGTARLKALLGPRISSEIANITTIPRAAHFRTFLRDGLTLRRPRSRPFLE